MRVLCLSIRQPFAAAIMTGQKKQEVRSWKTKHRGLLGIHASRTLADETDFARYPNFKRERVVRGALLGMVEIVDVEEAEDEIGSPYYLWKLQRPLWLPSPVKVMGRASLFWVELAEAQLPAELRG